MTPGNPPSLSYLYQLVFGLYMLVTTVVLINLLIAMMSDTYQRIQVTWNFLYSPFQTRRFWCNTITSSLHFYPLFNSNNLMWNGSLDWQNLSDQCTELTCHHLQSILSLLGLFICSGCVGKVSNKVTRFKKICFTVGIGKKSKVDDYSRLQDAQSAKSAGMFKKSIRFILLKQTLTDNFL